MTPCPVGCTPSILNFLQLIKKIYLKRSGYNATKVNFVYISKRDSFAWKINSCVLPFQIPMASTLYRCGAVWIASTSQMSVNFSWVWKHKILDKLKIEISPWLADKVDFDIGLPYRPASLYSWWDGTTTIRVDYIPQSDTKNFSVKWVGG